MNGLRLTEPPRKKPTIAFLYALRCPDTDAIRYVGSSSEPIARYRNHVSSAAKRKRWKDSEITNGRENPWQLSAREKWVSEVLESGKFPVLEILAVVPREIVVQCEQLLYYGCIAAGCDLTNGVKPNPCGDPASGSRAVRELMAKAVTEATAQDLERAQ